MTTAAPADPRHRHHHLRLAVPPRSPFPASVPRPFPTPTTSSPFPFSPSAAFSSATPSKRRLSSLAFPSSSSATSSSSSSSVSLSSLFLLLFSLRSLYSLLPFLRSSPHSFSLFPFSFLVSLLSLLVTLAFDPKALIFVLPTSPSILRPLAAKSLLLALVFLLRFQALRSCGTAATILADFSGSLAAKSISDNGGLFGGDGHSASARARKVRGFAALVVSIVLLSYGWDRIGCSPLSIYAHPKAAEGEGCMRVLPMLLPFLSGFLGFFERSSANWGPLRQLGRKRVRLYTLMLTTAILFVPAMVSFILESERGEEVSILNLGWPLVNTVIFGVVLSENYIDEKSVLGSKDLQKEFLVTFLCTLVLELFYFPQLSLPGLLFCGFLLWISVNQLGPSSSNYIELGSSAPSETLYSLIRYPIRHILSERKSRKIALFLLINTGYMVVEFVAGFMSNSLGLISDACHMLFDCAALAIGLYASYISRLPANNHFNYGRGRFEVLSGYVNAVFLVLVGALIVLESLERILDPQDISTNSLLTVSIGGLLVNVVGLVFFHEEHHHAHGGSGSCSHSHAHSHSHSHPHQHDHQHHHHSSHDHVIHDVQATNLKHSTDILVTHEVLKRKESNDHSSHADHYQNHQSINPRDIHDQGESASCLNPRDIHVQGVNASCLNHLSHSHEHSHHSHSRGTNCHEHGHHTHSHGGKSHKHDHHHCGTSQENDHCPSHGGDSYDHNHGIHSHDANSHKHNHNTCSYGASSHELNHHNHSDGVNNLEHNHHSLSDGASSHDRNPHKHSCDANCQANQISNRSEYVHHNYEATTNKSDFQSHEGDSNEKTCHHSECCGHKDPLHVSVLSNGNHSHSSRSNELSTEGKINEKLGKHRHIDHNMEGIFLHVLADTLGSVGVVVSTLLIKYKGWLVADPACSIFISVMIVSSVLPLLRNSAEILMQRVSRVHEQDLRMALDDVKRVEGICGVQNVHIWNYTNNEVVGTLHLQISEDTEMGSVKKQVSHILHDAGVKDLTIQAEYVKN